MMAINEVNIYEVNVRQYTAEGTLKAFEPHLTRLADMGITVLWFMPLTPIAMQKRKGTMGSYYSSADFKSMNPEFGEMEDFTRVVSKAHSLGMKVIVDWVANHTGWDHTWTKEHPEWYERDEHTGELKASEGMDDIVELDFNNGEMRKAMVESMRFWIEVAGIDGFRCDLAFWVPLSFWIEARDGLKDTKELIWLAETDGLDYPDYTQVFQYYYTWKWMHTTGSTLKLGDLLPVIQQYSAAPPTPAWFTTNHDENSWNGTEFEKYGDAAMMLMVFSCTWNGVPLIYSGQEIPNHRRLKFFDKDELDWSKGTALTSFFQRLFFLRRTNPAFKSGAPAARIHGSADENCFCYLRESGKDQVLVLLNFSGEEKRMELYDARVKGEYTDLFTAEKKEDKSYNLPPFGYKVLIQK